MLQYIPQQQDWLYRSPYFFFHALKQLIETYPEAGRKVKVKFAGKVQDWLPSMINSFGLQDKVQLLGEMSHQESLEFQQGCDAFLITSAKQLNGKADYSIAGKTFEYFQAMRPIIAFVSKSAQKELLEESGSALICDPDDAKGSAYALNELFTGKIQPVPNMYFLKTVSRESQTEKFASLIHSMIKQYA